MEKRKGKFIVLDGPDGSGKSTQARRLDAALQSLDLKTVLTKEPGSNDPICAATRELLLNPAHSGRFSSRAELLLFQADRAQHIKHTVRPAVLEGKIVISDRFDSSTFAYQCIARGVCLPQEFFPVNELATGGFRPDIYFWIDVDLETGRARNKGLVEKDDRIENERRDFHEKVREGFRFFFEEFARDRNYVKIDGSLSEDEIAEQIIKILKSKQLI